MPIRSFATALVLLATASVAEAAQSGCPQHFAAGEQPAVTNQVLLSGAKELCYLEFGVVHSGRTRTPLWVGEHLVGARIAASRDLEREDVFMAEAALSPDERAELSDYARSGYDRGHIAPAADMTTPAAMAESFSLANIVPQTAESNRGIWADVERTTRRIAQQSGEIYVITGPLFLGTTLTAIGDGVVVPTHVFKAIYDPSTGSAGAYVVENDGDPEWTVMSIAQLAEYSGFDPFPALPETIKAAAADLPAPGSSQVAGATDAEYEVSSPDAGAIRDLACSALRGLGRKILCK